MPTPNVREHKFTWPAFLTASSLALFPFVGYQLQIGLIGVSVDRLLLLIAVLGFVFEFLLRKRIDLSIPVRLTFMFLFHIAFVTIFLPDTLGDTSLTELFKVASANAMFLSLFLSLKLCPSSEEWLAAAIRVMAIALVGFFLYEMLTFLRTGSTAIRLPFVDSIPFLEQQYDDSSEFTGYKYGSSIRTSLPFGRPPMNGVTAAIVAALVWWECKRPASERMRSPILMVGLSAAVVMSGSRSALFPLLCALSIGWLVRLTLVERGRRWLLALIAAATISSLSVLGLFFDVANIAFSGALERFIHADTEAHMYFRVATWEEFSEASLSAQLFGHGANALTDRMGFGSHMSYGNILFDYGIVGLLLFLSFFAYAWALWFTVKSRIVVGEASALAGILVLIVVCHAAYQFQNIFSPWIGLGLVTGVLARRRRDMTSSNSLHYRRNRPFLQQLKFHRSSGSSI